MDEYESDTLETKGDPNKTSLNPPYCGHEHCCGRAHQSSESTAPIHFKFMFTMISYFHRYRLEFERQDGDCCDERLTMVSWYLA